MSNLGWYQIMTVLAKRVGGPLKLAGIIAGAGALAGGSAVGLGVAAKNMFDKSLEKKRQEAEAAIVYTITSNGKSNEGLQFRIGEKVRVLERDRDALLIERLDDENSPYYVSSKFLESISEYPSA